MPNRLVRETSPYLLQHADNPVDWYPWGAEAFEKARAENKPILLSVGYSACHWCHVMERESFENAEIAQVMNAHFVNVKVDREERPDVDAIYMSAVQAMTGSGGWPMTVFLTPEGKPFYGGTYFPPNDRYGMPGFPRVLEALAEAYRNRQAEIADSTASLLAQMEAFTEREPAPAAIAEPTLKQALEELQHRFDRTWGGFGRAPKFPPSMSLELLLRLHHRLGSEPALAMVEHTLTMMARGGLFDQLGGGFHRYSVDERWLVPHFEKMLYDNALLAHVYLLAFQATGKPLYREVATSTLDYVVREMTSPEGGFYSTQDADSEGHEGKFYVWSREEVDRLLGAEDGHLFSAVFDVTPEGNFEGQNILHLPRTLEAVASECGVDRERLENAIARGREVLFAARAERVWPGRDEKIITAWNGMMLKAFAEAARSLDRADYLQVAERNAEFLLATLWRDGLLLRTYKDGVAKLNGYLEDYANLVDGLLALYEATFLPRWLEAALAISDVMIAEFWDEDARAFFDTGKRHERLITRPRDVFDNATPAGNSVATDVLLRLGHLTADATLNRLALDALASAGEVMSQYPTGMGRLLTALDFHLASVREVVLVGEPASETMRAFRRELFAPYRPYQVVAGGSEGAIRQLAQKVALLRDRAPQDGRPTAYVCENFACRAPVQAPEALRDALDGRSMS